jgi:hypothetical protein
MGPGRRPAPQALLAAAFRLTASGAGFRARGTVLLRQTDFGMTPFTTAMGPIGVDDELRIEFDLLLAR